MKRTQRVEALKQVIAHTIKGERELAEALFKQVATSAAREILGEANYALDDDPEFDGRREMQRELEDDLEAGQMEPGADEMGGCPECGAEPCECAPEEGGDADATIDAIVSKLEAGDVDDEVLAMILDMVNDETEGGEGELGGEVDPELDPEADPEAAVPGEEGAPELGDEGEFDFDSLVKTESISGGAALMQKIKFALEYDYDQFLDSGGTESEWPSIALSNPSPELQELMAKIPEGQKGAYNSMIERIVHFQGGNSARLKDLI